MMEQGTGGSTTLYAWDGGSVIAEFNGVDCGMAWTKSYVYLGGKFTSNGKHERYSVPSLLNRYLLDAGGFLLQ